MKYLYRMIHISNVPHILEFGITHRNSTYANPNYKAIGDTNLIERRQDYCVTTVGGKTYRIGDFIPFYFYARMPMLYNIQHGYGVNKVNANEIVYAIVDINSITSRGNHDFFFSDGHAYNRIQTRFYGIEDFEKIDSILDLDAIKSNDWGTDSCIKHRKQAEFFVRDDIGAEAILYWICYSEDAKAELRTKDVDEQQILVKPIAYY